MKKTFTLIAAIALAAGSAAIGHAVANDQAASTVHDLRVGSAIHELAAEVTSDYNAGSKLMAMTTTHQGFHVTTRDTEERAGLLLITIAAESTDDDSETTATLTLTPVGGAGAPYMSDLKLDK